MKTQNDELSLDMSLQALLCGDFKRVEALRKVLTFLVLFNIFLSVNLL